MDNFINNFVMKEGSSTTSDIAISMFAAIIIAICFYNITVGRSSIISKLFFVLVIVAVIYAEWMLVISHLI